MQIYETVMVIRPTMEEDELKNVVEAVKKFLKKNEAEVLHEDSWGKKRLAYEIQKYKRAYYYLMDFEAGPEVLQKLEKYYRLSEDIIRSITIIPKPKTVKELRLSWKKDEVTREDSADGSKPE